MQALEGVEWIGPTTDKKSDLLITIPCYNERELLLEHLELLDKQKGVKFDVCVVLGNVFDEKAALQILKQKRNFNLVFIKRKEDTGSAGGFFAAQKFALLEGYEYIIMADVDCLPLDEGVVAAMYAQRAAGFVSPSESFEREGELPPFIPAKEQRDNFIPIYHYTLLSTELIKKIGLVFAPAYHGAEDAEYTERLEGIRRVFVDERVRHPFIIGDRTYRRLDRFWAYTLNTVALVRSPKRVLLNVIRALMSAWAMIFFFTSPLNAMGVKILSNMLTLRYGKAVFEDLKVDNSSRLITLDEKTKAGMRIARFDEYVQNPVSLFVRLVIDPYLNYLRKDVVVESSANDMQVTMLAPTVRRMYYNMGDGKYLLLADNGWLIVHFLKWVAYMYFQLWIVLIGILIFIIVRPVRGPKTARYGL